MRTHPGSDKLLDHDAWPWKYNQLQWDGWPQVHSPRESYHDGVLRDEVAVVSVRLLAD